MLKMFKGLDVASCHEVQAAAGPDPQVLGGVLADGQNPVIVQAGWFFRLMGEVGKTAIQVLAAHPGTIRAHPEHALWVLVQRTDAVVA